MNRPLRVLHLIDSLELGGAERVAVNLCNALNEMGIETYLAASRKEGPLLNALLRPDRYIFLRKRHTLDAIAFFRLLQLIERKNIQIIHAHSSSLGWAVLAATIRSVKVIWHDHYGNSEFLGSRRKVILRQLVKRSNHVFAVNHKLTDWAIKSLHCSPSKVSYLPNFPDLDLSGISGEECAGQMPIIVCTANLREPKGHDVLVESLAILKNKGFSFKALFIGKDSQDAYSQKVRELITRHDLQNEIELLGSRPDVGALIKTADIGVLASSSEGLPVSLLEYGLASLAVVCTSVGECSDVLGRGSYGLLVSPKDPEALAQALAHLIESPDERKNFGKLFHQRIAQHYSKAAVVEQLVNSYQSVLAD